MPAWTNGVETGLEVPARQRTTLATLPHTNWDYMRVVIITSVPSAGGVYEAAGAASLSGASVPEEVFQLGLYGTAGADEYRLGLFGTNWGGGFVRLRYASNYLLVLSTNNADDPIAIEGYKNSTRLSNTYHSDWLWPLGCILTDREGCAFSFSVKINDRGLVTQNVDIGVQTYSTSNNVPSNSQTISAEGYTSKEHLTTLFAKPITATYNLAWNDGSVALPIPNQISTYFPWSDKKWIIHGLAYQLD
jgi:hypothetical protein